MLIFDKARIRNVPDELNPSDAPEVWTCNFESMEIYSNVLQAMQCSQRSVVLK